MRCDNCGAEGISGKKFCAECGASLSNRCPKCGSECSPSARFCADCGASLRAAAAAAPRKPEQPQIRVAEATTSENLEGERKIVTFLFADITGSTELEHDLDPEEPRVIVDPALKLIRMQEELRRYSTNLLADGSARRIGIYALGQVVVLLAGISIDILAPPALLLRLW
ncbi:MAG TPA: zinc-ribbon domain-containing protein [Candidatus Binataceae bacterium]